MATVEHVVDGAASIGIKQHGKVVATGTVIGEDPVRDVALIRASAPIPGHVFRLSNREPELGESVAALGFPLGLPLSLTKGSVSGTNRKVPIDAVLRRELVQTDAAVNPGNSGGPLFAAGTGDVIGLVDLKDTEGTGIGFAVSSAVAQPLIRAWRAAPQTEPVSGCGPSEDTTTTADSGSSGPPDDGSSGPPDDGSADARTFDGADFSIDYPRSWTVKAAEVDKPYGTDTTIVSPEDPDWLLRVDVTPHATDRDPMVGAKAVVASIRRLPGYVEDDLSRETFDGYPAVHWEFDVRQDGTLLHKEDEFFVDDSGRGIAVLTQAPAAVYDADAFSALRETFTPY